MAKQLMGLDEALEYIDLCKEKFRSIQLVVLALGDEVYQDVDTYEKYRFQLENLHEVIVANIRIVGEVIADEILENCGILDTDLATAYPEIFERFGTPEEGDDSGT